MTNAGLAVSGGQACPSVHRGIPGQLCPWVGQKSGNRTTGPRDYGGYEAKGLGLDYGATGPRDDWLRTTAPEVRAHREKAESRK
jgi:hypothetical protein